MHAVGEFLLNTVTDITEGSGRFYSIMFEKDLPHDCCGLWMWFPALWSAVLRTQNDEEEEIV